MNPNHPLPPAELEALLDEILETEFTYRDVSAPVASLTGLRPVDQQYLLDWIRRVSSTNIELGYQYALEAPRLMERQLVERDVLESWILHAMDIYDREGLQAAKQIAQGLDSYLHDHRAWTHGCLLEQSEGVLQGFLQGLSGRRLKLSSAEVAYTDTETLFLPASIALLDSPKDNFLLYKGTIAQLWAQTRFGTFRAPLQRALERQSDTQAYLALFHALESLRLECRIEHELPGLHRELARIADLLGQQLPDEWQALRQQLNGRSTSLEQVLELTDRLLGQIVPCAPGAWHGELRHEAVLACMQARIERERILLKVRLRELQEEAGLDQETRRKAFSTDKPDPAEPAGEGDELETLELLLDGRPVPLPDDIRNLLSSIQLDLGEIPDEYLEAAGPGDYDPSLFAPRDDEAESVWSGTYHEEGAHLYPEWDFQRKAYRKNWCACRELELPARDGDFVAETLHKHAGLLKHLRRTFEAMRDENRLLKRQTFGDDIDLDALIEALADANDGREMSDRLFTRNHLAERNIAVVFMVDMSGSTKGWINQAEREALVLLCESLETLGDRYAIYGFSSVTRKRCELFHIKHFSDPYDAATRARIAAIEPRDYTRMGFAIRHLTRVLREIDARTRILITLSDGKPDDYDSYRGEYGIEDTRHALIEARREGVHPYCITIDTEARDYLSHLYGPAAWTLVDDVKALPQKVSDIYRRLTC